MSTTIGSYGDGRDWVAVALEGLGGEVLLVEQRQARPDDRNAAGAIVGRYESVDEARAVGEAWVLAHGGQLGLTPEQLAGSPVRGPVAVDLPAPGRLCRQCGLDERDSTRVERAVGEAMFSTAIWRYLHLPVPLRR